MIERSRLRNKGPLIPQKWSTSLLTKRSSWTVKMAHLIVEKGPLQRWKCPLEHQKNVHLWGEKGPHLFVWKKKWTFFKKGVDQKRSLQVDCIVNDRRCFFQTASFFTESIFFWNLDDWIYKFLKLRVKFQSVNGTSWWWVGRRISVSISFPQ